MIHPQHWTKSVLMSPVLIAGDSRVCAISLTCVGIAEQDHTTGVNRSNSLQCSWQYAKGMGYEGAHVRVAPLAQRNI